MEPAHPSTIAATRLHAIGSLDELLSYPDVPRQLRTLDLDASAVPFLAIELCKDDTHSRFLATLASLGTPYDITLHELRDVRR